MATFTGNGTGSNMYGYMHARVVVTRTDNSNGTTCSVKVECYAISDGGSSSFISGRASSNEACTTWSNYSGDKSLSSGGTTFMTSASFTVNRTKSSKTITCKAQILGGGTGMYNGLSDTASVNVTIPALATYTVSYNANKPTNVTASVQGMPTSQTKYHGTGLTLSTNQPSLTNYIFKGWAESASGNVLIQPGASYTYTGNANKTYYAKWELVYRKPEISNLTIFRTATSNGTTNNEDGEYMRVSFNWAQDSSITGTNAPTIKIGARIKGSSSEYATCKTETSTSGTSGTYATTVSFGDATFDKTLSYDIQISITDNRSSKPSGNDGTTSVTDTLSQSYVLLDFSPKGIGVGTTAPSDKQLNIGINTNVNANIICESSNLTSNTSTTENGNSQILFSDALGAQIGFLGTRFEGNNQFTRIMTQRSITNTAGTTTNTYNGIYFGIDDQGNSIDSFYNTNSQQAFQKALGIEQKSSTNDYGTWYWITVNKFVLAQFISTKRTLSSLTSWGNLYYFDFGSISFPITFATYPQTSISFADNGDYLLWGATTQVTKSQIGHIYAIRANNVTGSFRYCLTAIGTIS